jgi:hypothetical protein
MTDELKFALGLASVIAGLFMLGKITDKMTTTPPRSPRLVVNPSLGREM